MPGRKPIFATLVSDLYYWIRDLAIRVLEPSAPAGQKNKDNGRKDQERKPW